MTTRNETGWLAASLEARYGERDALAIIAAARGAFPGRTALVSSFGAEAAVLLALAAEVDPAQPVVFIDTGRHFGETLRYRDRLTEFLGLTDVRTVGPEAPALRRKDPDEMLFARDGDACCFLRKVLPLRRALADVDAWFTGRKRYQGGVRGDLPVFEAADGKVKVNPLAAWTRADIEAEFLRRDLPRHPLEADGFLSIGCAPCTDRVASGDAASTRRDGRWAGADRDECGIHLSFATLAGEAVR